MFLSLNLSNLQFLQISSDDLCQSLGCSRQQFLNERFQERALELIKGKILGYNELNTKDALPSHFSTRVSKIRFGTEVL